MRVVADTSPLSNFVQLGLSNVLTQLYSEVWAPPEVLRELSHPRAPKAVRVWAAGLPASFHLRKAHGPVQPELATLHEGEKAAILLGINISADLLLIDERKATYIALELGIQVMGTLGVIREAHALNLIDGAETYSRLLAETSFRHTDELTRQFLASLKTQV